MKSVKSFAPLFFFLMIILYSIDLFAAEKPAGTILRARGKVLIQKGAKVVADPEGKRGRSSVKKGSPFYQGETIVTKEGARVKLGFAEGNNEVVLGPNTSLVIERAPADPRLASGTTLDLKQGKIRSDVRRKYSGEGTDVFEVKTPNAVAGVRGTIFSAMFDRSSSRSNFATERGQIEVKGLSQSRGGSMVGAGMYSYVEQEGQAAPAAPIKNNKSLEKALKELKEDRPSKNANEASGSSDEARLNPKSNRRRRPGQNFNDSEQAEFDFEQKDENDPPMGDPNFMEDPAKRDLASEDSKLPPPPDSPISDMPPPPPPPELMEAINTVPGTMDQVKDAISSDIGRAYDKAKVKIRIPGSN